MVLKPIFAPSLPKWNCLRISRALVASIPNPISVVFALAIGGTSTSSRTRSHSDRVVPGISAKVVGLQVVLGGVMF